MTRCNVDEGNQRMKVLGLLFNLSLNCHLSLQPDFVLTSTETTSIFSSFFPCCPLLNLHVYYSPVSFLSDVIFFHRFLQHNQPTATEAFSYSPRRPCLQLAAMPHRSTLSFKSFSVSPFRLVWHGCQSVQAC